jgi:glycosyltransferase involved in cell wall biosynthesis
MRRIAIIFEFGTLNGGEHSMLAAIERMPLQDIEVVALAPADGRLSRALAERGIRHIPLSLRDETNARLPREMVAERLVAAISEADPHIVHANSLSMGRLTGAIADQLGLPCIAHLRDILKLSRAAINDLNRNRLLVAVSEATRTFHVAQGLDADRTLVLYNGVDRERFQPRDNTGWLKRELSLDAQTFLIGTVGQIGLRKAQDVLAKAAVLVGPHLPDVHFLLIGERNSSKAESITFEQNVALRFHEAKLGDRLHALGYRDDMPALLNELDLLVHPAKQEPLGRVLLEAAAAGLPIIATNVGGTPEILQDSVSARLIPPGDAESLAAAIRELHADAVLKTQFAREAVHVVQRRFDIDVASQRLFSLWEGIRIGT